LSKIFKNGPFESWIFFSWNRSCCLLQETYADFKNSPKTETKKMWLLPLKTVFYLILFVGILSLRNIYIYEISTKRSSFLFIPDLTYFIKKVYFKTLLSIENVGRKAILNNFVNSLYHTMDSLFLTNIILNTDFFLFILHALFGHQIIFWSE
jgi:hypothetical protein